MSFADDASHLRATKESLPYGALRNAGAELDALTGVFQHLLGSTSMHLSTLLGMVHQAQDGITTAMASLENLRMAIDDAAAKHESGG